MALQVKAVQTCLRGALHGSGDRAKFFMKGWCVFEIANVGTRFTAADGGNAFQTCSRAALYENRDFGEKQRGDRCVGRWIEGSR